MIDPHVHLRDWNQKEKETIAHGLEVGLAAGVDTFFDMPNTNPPLTSRENLLARLEKGEKAASLLSEKTGRKVSYHVYGGLTSERSQIEEMVQAYRELYPRVVGLKLFASQSTGNMGIIGKERQEAIWKTLAELGYRGVVGVHCEKEEVFRKDTPDHTLIRWNGSETASVVDQIDSVEKAGFKGILHIAHISTKGALEAVEAAKARGMRITCGVTPHHALLNRNEGYTLWRKMNPPLRNEEDRKAIYEALLSGQIDWIESDHAPHTLLDKEKNASGIPGFEGTALLVESLRKDGISEELLAAVTGGNILRAFGLKETTSLPPTYTQETKKLLHEAYPFSAWS